MNKVIIAGGTGFIGSAVTDFMLDKGFRVGILSRKTKESKKEGLSYHEWNPTGGELSEELMNEADAVINLAGRNVGDKRWNKTFKQEIINSRVESTRLIVDRLNKKSSRTTLINASAIGYYGPGDELKHENSGPGNDFMARVCAAWENEVHKADSDKVRKVILRFGVVLGKTGGALPEIARPIKYGMGAALGTGKQAFPWIHIEDICRIIHFALTNGQVQGIYNAVSPGLVTNKELTMELSRTLKRPIILPAVPAPVLGLLLGEFSESLTGNFPISSEKIEGQGFRFNYPKLSEALKEIYD